MLYNLCKYTYHWIKLHAKSCSYYLIFAEDEEEQVPKPKPGSTKRTRGSTKRQPAAKRQKKSNVEDSPPSLSKVSQPALKGPNLSASSSSSEDEFDSLVKSWNGEISVDTTAIEDAASVRTKGQKRTKRGN